MNTVPFIGTLAAMVMISLVLTAAAGKINSHYRGVRNLMLGSSALVALCIGITIIKWIWN
jgi:hypothetical protein